MSDELDILKIVAENPAISQRKISEKTGISLGQVNFLIKKCVKKGLIKIEGQTTKSIKYNLTPKGIAEKAKLTLEYIKISYEAVIRLTDKIRAIAERYEAEGRCIYIYGDEDEMMSIVKLAIGNMQLFRYDLSNAVILYWDAEIILTDFQSGNNEWINILE